MNKKLLAILILLIVFAGNVFAVNVITSVTLESGASDTNKQILGVKLVAAWDAGCTADKFMAFNCADSNGAFLPFNESHSVDLTKTALYPDCNIAEGVKKIFAWIQCDYNSLSRSLIANASITLDLTPPAVAIAQDGATQNTKEISFTLSDDLSDINIESLIVKVKDTVSGSFTFTTSCTMTDNKNYSCTYYEISLIEGDNAIEITVKNKAGNQKVQTATVTYDITPPTVPNGQTCTSGLSNVPLGWTANNTDADINKYYIYRGTTQGFTVNESNKIKTVNHATVCTGTTCSTTNTENLSNGQTYYYKITAVDKVGNESTQFASTGGCTPTITTTLATPIISSSTHPNEGNWYSNNDPEFDWTSSGTGVTYYYLLNGTSDTIVTTSNGTSAGESRSVTFSDVSNGVHYFHVRAKKGDVLSDNTDHFKIIVDNSIPDAPDDFSLSLQSDGDIRLNWNKPSDPGGSGINRYYIIRGFEGDALGKDDYDEQFSINDEDQENYTDTSVFSGSNYCYRMYSVDYAENESDLTSKQCKKSTSDGDIDIQIDLANYVKPGRTQINISSTGGEMVDCWLWLQKAGETSFKRLSGTDFTDRTSSTQYYTFNEDDKGTAEFKVVCENGDKTKTTKVDISKPIIAWIEPKINDSLNGTVDLIAEATDTDYGVVDVTFYLNGTKLAKVTSAFEANKFKYNWNSSSVSGEVKLKAIATDKGGNTAETEITVNAEGSKGQAEAETAIAAANAAKAKVEALEAKFSAVNLPLPPVAGSLEKQAEAKLELANTYAGKKDFANAEAKAKEAEEKFSELLGRFGAPEELIVKDFSFANEELDGLVKGLLSNEEQAIEAAANLTDSEATRTLKVFKLADGETESYMIAIETTITNKTTGSTVQVIEVIPKELALTSDLIVSALPFEVIENDPIIVFDVNVEPGEKATISYGVNKALSKEEFDSMNSDAVFSSCNKPPLYFAQETILSKDSFSDKAVQSPVAFAGLAEFLPWIGGLIVIAVIAFVAFNVLKNREPREPESFSPLESAVSKHGGMGLGLFGKKSDREPRAPKWGYKGV